MPCCRHNSAVASPASPCFKIVMICSSLCRVPFICVSPSWVWEKLTFYVAHFSGARSHPSCQTCSAHTEKATPLSQRGLYLCRQRPTLPHTFACSTIGPAGLNFRVRDGNGWNPRGKITDNLMQLLATSPWLLA